LRDHATRVRVCAANSCVKPGSHAGLARVAAAQCGTCRGERMPTGRSLRSRCERDLTYI
jgi:hypothetical protein